MVLISKEITSTNIKFSTNEQIPRPTFLHQNQPNNQPILSKDMGWYKLLNAYDQCLM